ncbi:hypothetical protein P692DRAFT_20317150 [Suillus brevipes Sb2]|nr:hypothetical protein P692DRAFT_20317150 [Suillus brevipes Sb2]
MLSKRVIAAARSRPFLSSRNTQCCDTAVSLSKGWKVADSHMRRAQFHSSHLLQGQFV